MAMNATRVRRTSNKHPVGLEAWEAYRRHLPLLCTLQRATTPELQREDSWFLWGFNYANEFIQHGVRLP